MADEIASVSLEADASAFDQTVEDVFDLLGNLGKTTSKILTDAGTTVDDVLGKSVQGIGKQLTDVIERFANAGSSVGDKIAAAAGSLGGSSAALFATLSEELNGSTVLADVGAKVGTLIGGPAGMVLGHVMGETLGSAIDLSGILDVVGELAFGVAGAFDGMDQFWANTVADARTFFAEVREALRDLGLGQLLAGDLENAMHRFENFFDRVLASLREKLELLLGRIANGVDYLFSRVQEPLAKVLDVIQRTLVNIGLLDQAAEGWGDQLRNIVSLSEEVFRAIGFGLGYLEGLFERFGGRMADWLISPLMGAIGEMLELLRESLDVISRNVGGNLGADARAAVKDIEGLQKKLVGWRADVDAWAPGAKAADPMQRGKEWGDAAADAIAQFKAKANEANQAIAALQAQQMAWIENALGGVWKGIKGDAAAVWDFMKDLKVDPKTLKLAPTLKEGSQEASKAIIAARAGAENPMEKGWKAQERAAVAAEKMAVEVEEQTEMLRRVSEVFGQIEAV